MMLLSIFKSLIILGILVALVWMLIDAINREFQKPIYKVLWMAALTFLPMVGMAAYYYFVMYLGKKELVEDQKKSSTQ